MAGEPTMRPLTDLVTFERALALIAGLCQPIERSERVELAASGGRVLVDDVRAAEDAPASDRSRMDGYAVSSLELSGLKAGEGRPLKVLGRSLAGAPLARALEVGTCAEIATGAELPQGADAVVPVEHTRPASDEARVEVVGPVERYQHVLRKASDYRAGEVLVAGGQVLTPAKVAAAAAAHATTVLVRERPRVLIVPTGDEVQPLGGPLGDGRVRESNTYGLAAFIASRGGLPERHPILPDVEAELDAALLKVAAYDAAVFTGGSSAGSKDFLAAGLARAGKVAFHGVQVRPAKPVLFGHVHGRPVLGLPGNPTSCMVGAHLFLDRVLSGLLGTAPGPITTTRARLEGDLRALASSSPPGFLTLVLVRLEGGRAVPVLRDSMTVTGAGYADGFVALPAGKSPPASGEDVPVVLLR